MCGTEYTPRPSRSLLCGSISNPAARKEKYMNSKPKRVLLRVSSVLMLLAALPMLLWCLNLIDNAALDYTYAGAGCFAAGIAYIFSMVTATAGLAFAGRLHRHRWCRTLAYIQLAAGVLLFIPLRSYAALTLPPLFLLTVLYLFGVGWREKRDYEQQ
ncbi:MAG: hypothetical protein PWP48_288 [Clostridiales bacterium]|nr:hypothetical protein [Clostridiales bacterium]